MAIRFQCEQCGKSFEVRDELAGKSGQCKQCGGRIQIPDRRAEEPELDVYGFDDPAPPIASRDPEPAASGKGGWATRPTSDSGPSRAPATYPDPPKDKRPFSLMGEAGAKGALGAFVVIALLGFRVYNAQRKFRARNAPRGVVERVIPAPGTDSIDLDGPIALPAFPDPGPARTIDPGVSLREVSFGPPSADPNAPPGHSGKLWIYLPEGDHPARSLPCVLIAGAGSNLISGMRLGDGDRAEHLPYVRSGFAVVAYELDGSLDDLPDASEAGMMRSAAQFLRARAGLVNAHIALEYALAKVPQIDPGRVAAAGHSSAGTMAVLFAEHEPRLRACVAYAPALDLAERFGPEAASSLRQVGLGPLVDRFSPRVGMASLGCPLFLFHARDDDNVPARQSEAFAADLKAQGKPITLEVVPAGDHYDSMIRQGIPRAIEWLRGTLGKASGPDPEA